MGSGKVKRPSLTIAVAPGIGTVDITDVRIVVPAAEGAGGGDADPNMVVPCNGGDAWRLGVAEGAVRVLTGGTTRLNDYQSWRHAYGPDVTKQSNEKRALNGVLINDDDYAVDGDGEDALLGECWHPFVVKAVTLFVVVKMTLFELLCGFNVKSTPLRLNASVEAGTLKRIFAQSVSKSFESLLVSYETDECIT
uniref:Uncharacterized protein n=1 Tax=Glossina pallidipes TaxID=7398 RepID=A0A1B0AFM6_GLOPL